MHQPPAASRDLESNLTIKQLTLGVPELDAFLSEGLILDVYAQLPSGKEATVYCCRAHPSTRRKFLAAKVYREHAARSIRRGLYFEGRERGMKARELRAIANGSRFGHQVMTGVWIAEEYSCLQRLSGIGVSVPTPWAASGRAILMDYVGNGAGPAPQLDGVTCSATQARQLFEQLLEGIERMLSEHLVHGDLSPYNVLVWKEQTWIIDLPQAVDVRFNRNAYTLLQRDVERICTFFERFGIVEHAQALTEDLWTRYQRALL